METWSSRLTWGVIAFIACVGVYRAWPDDSAVDRAKSAFVPSDCAGGGDPADAFFSPRDPAPGEPVDGEPLGPASEFAVTHAGDLKLPEGVLLESGGEYLGDGGVPVAVAAPGAYPLYFLTHRTASGDQPAFVQLVIDSDAEPIRWVDDDRFGSGTDGGVNWIGSPTAAFEAFVSAEDAAWEDAFWEVYGQILGEECVWFDLPSVGASAMLFANGYGDGWTPAAAGYDEDGALVAITWFLRTSSWVLAGIPGVPPSPVVEQLTTP